MFARRNEGAVLFRDVRDHTTYLTMLDFVVRRFGWRCLAYCLMPNHMHLLVETPQPNLAAGMQRLHGDYGRWFSNRRRTPGHVFGSRYGAVRTQDDTQLLSVAAYLALNPVAAGLAPEPERWRWGSHNALTGRERAPGFLDVARLPELLAGSLGGDGRRRYAAYVSDRRAVAERTPGSGR